MRGGCARLRSGSPGRKSGFSGTQWKQLADDAPRVPLLDFPVPLMVDKLEDVLKIVDLFVPEQEIGKPFLSSSSPGSSWAAGRRNSWWTCPCRTSSWHMAGAILASNGARSLRGAGGATGGWLALAMFSGAARRDFTASQGRNKNTGQGTFLWSHSDKFQQSSRCLSFSSSTECWSVLLCQCKLCRRLEIPQRSSWGGS